MFLLPIITIKNVGLCLKKLNKIKIAHYCSLCSIYHDFQFKSIRETDEKAKSIISEPIMLQVSMRSFKQCPDSG